MASRAETLARPAPLAAPGLGTAIRAALSDGYYHSWRLVPANLLWAVVAMTVAVTVALFPPAIVVAPVLAVPTAGIFRIATRIVRGEAVSFWDAVDAWRTNVLATLGLGAAAVLVGVVLSANTVIGLGADSPLGWAMATLAAWGLVALWLLAWTAGPVLADPARAGQPIGGRLRLAALLVLAHPVRIGALGLVLAIFLVLSTIAIAALVTVSVSFAALVASQYVLPAADRLEERLAGG